MKRFLKIAAMALALIALMDFALFIYEPAAAAAGGWGLLAVTAYVIARRFWEPEPLIKKLGLYA